MSFDVVISPAEHFARLTSGLSLPHPEIAVSIAGICRHRCGLHRCRESSPLWNEYWAKSHWELGAPIDGKPWLDSYDEESHPYVSRCAEWFGRGNAVRGQTRRLLAAARRSFGDDSLLEHIRLLVPLARSDAAAGVRLRDAVRRFAPPTLTPVLVKLSKAHCYLFQMDLKVPRSGRHRALVNLAYDHFYRSRLMVNLCGMLDLFLEGKEVPEQEILKSLDALIATRGQSLERDLTICRLWFVDTLSEVFDLCEQKAILTVQKLREDVPPLCGALYRVVARFLHPVVDVCRSLGEQVANPDLCRRQSEWLESLVLKELLDWFSHDIAVVAEYAYADLENPNSIPLRAWQKDKSGLRPISVWRFWRINRRFKLGERLVGCFYIAADGVHVRLSRRWEVAGRPECMQLGLIVIGSGAEARLDVDPRGTFMRS